MPYDFTTPEVRLECGECGRVELFEGRDIAVDEPGAGWLITPEDVGEWEWAGDEVACPDCKR